MKQIPTAEDILESIQLENGAMFSSYISPHGNIAEIVNKAMIEFAKLHVEAALESVIVNRDNDEDSFYVFGSLEDESRIGNYDLSGLRCSLNKDSVLKCYPLEKIK